VRLDHVGTRQNLIWRTEIEALRDPASWSPRYGWAAVSVIGGLIVLAGLARLPYLVRDSTRLGKRLSRNAAYPRAMAAGRLLSSKQYRFAGWHLPAVASSLLILVPSLAFFTWGFAVRPYYYVSAPIFAANDADAAKSRWGVGSAPLAMRTGFFCAGIYPWIM
jgi:hypothetical protein